MTEDEEKDLIDLLQNITAQMEIFAKINTDVAKTLEYILIAVKKRYAENMALVEMLDLDIEEFDKLALRYETHIDAMSVEAREEDDDDLEL